VNNTRGTAKVATVKHASNDEEYAYAVSTGEENEEGETEADYIYN